jgi:hypothetical protein
VYPSQTLRHPEGQDVLAVGDMVVFPEGPDGAHQLINESAAATRVLILSTMREPYGCAYPDSGKLSTLGGVFRIGDAVDYWDGESVGRAKGPAPAEARCWTGCCCSGHENVVLRLLVGSYRA